jgi:REP element-mobilizing transposase RayT
VPTIYQTTSGCGTVNHAAICSCQRQHFLFHGRPRAAPNRLLIDEIDRLRHIYKIVQQRHPFETVAICILPDHIHAVWALPDGDANFATRWSSIKSGFSRGLDAQTRSASKVSKRKKVFGSDAIGNMPLEMRQISNAISITFISIQ